MMKPMPCRRCGKPIVFCDRPGGGKYPLDAEPHPRGCIVLDATGCMGPKNPGDRPDLSVRYMPHFITCDGEE